MLVKLAKISLPFGSIVHSVFKDRFVEKLPDRWVKRSITIGCLQYGYSAVRIIPLLILHGHYPEQCRRFECRDTFCKPVSGHFGLV
ncbi:hypothetical protein D3C81_1865020 [compost metagenome]